MFQVHQKILHLRSRWLCNYSISCCKSWSWTVFTHAGMGRVFSHACPCSNRKTAWAINTKLGTRILYSNRSACIDVEVQRSNG